MKGLVFGESGQVARALAVALVSLDSVRFVNRAQADLTQPDALAALIESLNPDVVINAAAYTAVDQAETQAALAQRVNAEAPGALAAACARTGAWLIHYSTDYVFDGRATQPYTEDSPTAPANVYGRSKLAGEQAIQAVQARSLVFRTSWVYSNHGRNFLNTMLRLAAERDALRIVADQVGAPTWAGAIARATDQVVAQLAARRVDEQAAGIYHMSSAGRTSWCDFAREIFRLRGLAGRVQVQPITTREFPTPATRPYFSLLCNDKLARVFGVRLAPWQDALQECLSERRADQ